MKKAILACCVVMALSGCSTTSALTGLIGSKPEISAQAGAENIKQTVGVTAKQEQKNETTIRDSQVGKVDTSTKKTESIKAGTIQAERIEIRNGGDSWEIAIGMFVAGLMFGAAAVTFYAVRRKEKGA